MLTLEEVGKSEGSDIDHYVIQGGGGSGERERRGVVIAVSHLFPLPLFPRWRRGTATQNINPHICNPPPFFFLSFFRATGVCCVSSCVKFERFLG